jgi:hypothetical protein
MATSDHTTSFDRNKPNDPEVGLRPGEAFMVDGLDWSWAFVWFKEIPDCPGYWIGSNGSLWSFRDNSGKPKDKCRRLIPDTVPRGHKKKSLRDTSGKRRMFFIHSLVNEMFNSPRPEGMVCRHRDGNPSKNHYWNVHWGTVLDNIHDRDRVHKTTARGTSYPHAKASPTIVEDMYNMCDAGVLVKDIAAKYAMDPSNVRRILVGDAWAGAVPGRKPPLKGVNGRQRAWLSPDRKIKGSRL